MKDQKMAFSCSYPHVLFSLFLCCFSSNTSTDTLIDLLGFSLNTDVRLRKQTHQTDKQKRTQCIRDDKLFNFCESVYILKSEVSCKFGRKGVFLLTPNKRQKRVDLQTTSWKQN